MTVADLLPVRTGPKYLQVADYLEGQMQRRLLAGGDKLPSVRLLSRELKLSISTILQAYYELEARGLVAARPQSGYYVHVPAQAPLALPHRTQPAPGPPVPCCPSAQALIADVLNQLATPSRLPFALGVPAPALLPISKLNKALAQAQRELKHAGTSYEAVTGNAPLRRQIARHALFWGGQLTPDELIVTEGCTAALALC